MVLTMSSLAQTFRFSNIVIQSKLSQPPSESVIRTVSVVDIDKKHNFISVFMDLPNNTLSNYYKIIKIEEIRVGGGIEVFIQASNINDMSDKVTIKYWKGVPDRLWIKYNPVLTHLLKQDDEFDPFAGSETYTE